MSSKSFIFILLILVVGWSTFQYNEPSPKESTESMSAFVYTTNKQLMFKGQRYFLHGINYYPQETPWDLFWTDFKPQVISSDLKKIKNLGFNTVRIFVPFKSFGGIKVDSEMTKKLNQFLDLAHTQQLKCIITLFDFFTDYENLGATQGHIQDLLKDFERHPAILAWDLKNEGDSDYKYGKEKVIRWVDFTANLIHRLDQNHLVTAGWRDIQNTPDIAKSLDYVTFHYYGYEEAFETKIKAVKQKIKKPLVLGEYGFHTWKNAQPDAHIPEHQYNYFNAILAAANAQDLAGSMVWNLYDYASDGFSIQMLKTESFQHHLGILDLHKNPKSGLIALSQGAFLRDAKTHQSIHNGTQTIELVVRLKAPETLMLHLNENNKILKTKNIQAKAGINTFQWPLSADLRKDLIYMKKKYFLEGSHIIKPNGKALKGSHYLKIREK